MPSQAEVRKAITNRIVEALREGGIPPWRSPWVGHPNAGLPTNIMSNKRYRGINVLLLPLHQLRYGLKSKFFGRFNQWKGSYAEGELRAEIAAAFALAELGVPQSDDLSNTQAYVASWLEAMANDPSYVFRASTQASKAVDYLLAFSRTPVEEPEEALAE